MGYRIEGDCTWNNTKIWKDGDLVDYEFCYIYINEHYCEAFVNCQKAHLDRVVLLGVYRLIGDGEFNNTKLSINDELLRGISSVDVFFGRNRQPTINVKAVFLPNIVEETDDSPTP